MHERVHCTPYLFCAWNFHDKTTTSKKCDLISLFLKRGETVFIFCTTNGKTNKNGPGWPGDHDSNPQSFQNKTPHQKGQGTQGNFPFFGGGGLPVWNGDKCTSQCLKNWIQVTAQSLLSSETQGSPGTFSESRHCLWGQDSISAHVLAWWYRPGLLAFLN